MDANNLIVEQVIDLEKRTKAAISDGNVGLTESLAIEYVKIVQMAVINSLASSKKYIYHELSLLKSETNLIPHKSKEDPLIQLKWLDNSVSKLKLLVKKLQPDKEIEIELHLRVLEAAGELFQNKHYSQAIFEAFKALEEYVRKKSGRNEYGEYLMSKVFDENNPILKIKYSCADERDEQKGFRFIFMGVMTGIRNPKGHHTVTQQDRERTLQYLSLASLLFKTVDDTSLS